MAVTKLRPHFTFNEERLAQLNTIAPEAFADGRVNWEALQEALGENLEAEENSEHFGLFWPGKREARRQAGIPPLGTLVPKTGEGVDEETTRNIFIEGENLEVLKLLQKSYGGRVKMIYIDPPYNTGNDFVYDDNFTEGLDDYLRRTGMIDEEGRRLTTNSKADGRFHSRWLSMMYPRLRLARNLLREDGVIFVSIDDNEVHHLRTLMNEVFGEENFISEVIVQTNPRGRTLDKYIAKTHEYILVYTKDPSENGLYQIEKSDQAKAGYSMKDEEGSFRLLELRNRNPVFHRGNRPNLYYPIYVDTTTWEVSLEKSGRFTQEVLPLNSKGKDGCWTWGKEKVSKNLKLLVGKKVNTGAFRVYRKDYLGGSSEFTKAKSVWTESSLNHENGKEAVGKLFGSSPFDFPKSPHLIKKCLELSTSNDEQDIVVDFFAGSGTTAHSVFLKNLEDGGNRRFVLVQVGESINDLDGKRPKYKSIAEVTAQRIRLASQSLVKELKSPTADLGFKVFSLRHSNYKAWEDVSNKDIGKLELQFEDAADPLIKGWKETDLLAEVMLLEGFPLDSQVSVLAEIKKNRVHRVTSDFHEHSLLVCLDKKVEAQTISALHLQPTDVLITLDSALTDEQKLALDDKGMLRTI